MRLFNQVRLSLPIRSKLKNNLDEFRFYDAAKRVQRTQASTQALSLHITNSLASRPAYDHLFWGVLHHRSMFGGESFKDRA